MKRIAASFGVAVLLGCSTPVMALDAAVSLSTDLRGVVYLAESLYKGLGSDTSDEDQGGGSSADGGKTVSSSRESSDSVNFAVRPSLHVEASQQLYQRQKIIFGIKGEIVYLSFGVRYPNGFSFQSGGRRILFTEPSSIRLSSFDAGIGSFVSFELSPRMSMGGEIMYVYQSLSIKSTLGNWNLKDILYDRRIDGAIWIDYEIGNNLFKSPVQPSLRFRLAHRHNEASFNMGVRLAF